MTALAIAAIALGPTLVGLTVGVAIQLATGRGILP
jgi:hypothetical protein